MAITKLSEGKHNFVNARKHKRFSKFGSTENDKNITPTIRATQINGEKYITAEFARQLFGESQYYNIILKDDTMLNAVLK